MTQFGPRVDEMWLLAVHTSETEKVRVRGNQYCAGIKLVVPWLTYDVSDSSLVHSATAMSSDS